PTDPEPWGPADSLPPLSPLAPTQSASRTPIPGRPKSGRKLGTLITIGAVVVTGAWFSAGLLRSDVTVEVPTPVTAVRVTTGSTGVTVRYDDVPYARIVELNKATGSRIDHRVVDGELIVDQNGRTGFRFGPSWGQRLEIVLPTKTADGTPDIHVRTSSGGVTLDGRFGATDITTTTGAIRATGSFEGMQAKVTTGSVRVEGTTPSVAAQTTTGSVDMQVTDAQNVTARTSTGSVDVAVTGPQPNTVTARTNTGGIDLKLPDGAYQVQAKSNTGSVKVGVPEDPASPHRVEAQASTGSVRIS
ncbi:MAG: DUF4097 family beta strand repeat-containing protein, partial [Propionibacteriaceae bacterium]|nr:DUF4097 family beta strand repeat-containing protein [Propionibacteriaceae bacterium]